MEIEAAGGAATAGLVAAAVEKPTGEAGAASEGVCTDCGAAVSSRFCADCGQPVHVHRTLAHLAEEVLHGVLHFDGRIWRTLPLLMLNPGRLTREWVQGRRTRYVSPLAMFLFTVFLAFFLFSFGGLEPRTEPRAQDGEQASEQASAAVAEARGALADVNVRTDAQAGSLRAATTALDEHLAELETAPVAEERADGLKRGSWQAGLKDAAKAQAEAEGGHHGLNGKILKKLENPDLALYKITQTLYKFAFLLVPISIPFVALLFLWRRGFTLYDHAVFVLYSLTAMAILFTAMAWLGRVPVVGGLVVLAGLAAAPAHMFAQVKGAYGLPVFSAGWRTLALLGFSILASGLFLMAIVYLGLAG